MNRRRALGGLLVLGPLLGLAACKGKPAASRESFIATWHSSRLNQPIRLNANGEWEALDPAGKVSHYGVWDFKEGAIHWGYQQDHLMIYEINPLLSFSGKSFTLQESDRTVTTFTRLD